MSIISFIFFLLPINDMVAIDIDICPHLPLLSCYPLILDVKNVWDPFALWFGLVPIDYHTAIWIQNSCKSQAYHLFLHKGITTDLLRNKALSLQNHKDHGM